LHFCHQLAALKKQTKRKKNDFCRPSSLSSIIWILPPSTAHAEEEADYAKNRYHPSQPADAKASATDLFNFCQ